MDDIGFYAIVFLALYGLWYVWFSLERKELPRLLRVARRSERPVAYWFELTVNLIATALLLLGVVVVGLGLI